jgi:hypothetical protein
VYVNDKCAAHNFEAAHFLSVWVSCGQIKKLEPCRAVRMQNGPKFLRGPWHGWNDSSPERGLQHSIPTEGRDSLVAIKDQLSRNPTQVQQVRLRLKRRVNMTF